MTELAHFSPLARINKGNVKGLRLAYAIALGGAATDHETSPLRDLHPQIDRT
jgi:hypothetical protein